jgi:hypothetical protein
MLGNKMHSCMNACMQVCMQRSHRVRRHVHLREPRKTTSRRRRSFVTKTSFPAVRLNTRRCSFPFSGSLSRVTSTTDTATAATSGGCRPPPSSAQIPPPQSKAQHGKVFTAFGLLPCAAAAATAAGIKRRGGAATTAAPAWAHHVFDSVEHVADRLKRRCQGTSDGGVGAVRMHHNPSHALCVVTRCLC